MTLPAPAAPVSVRDAVQALARTLESRDIDEALALAEWAVADLIRVGRAELRTEGARVLNGPDRARLAERAERLAADEPLQYVLGHADFLGRRFACDARALIPRPETEELVLTALRLALPDPIATVRVADVGTGSGCIAISLALERPNAAILATDTSAAALALAESNARALGTAGRVRFLCVDLLGGTAPDSLDAVVSNPPYIESPVLAGLDRRVRDFEPRAALDGGPDGLDTIRRLAPAAVAALRPGGHILLEIGETQGPAVRTLLSHAGFAGVRILPDLCRRERFAVGIRAFSSPPRGPGIC
ncbi:MAG: protein-(glutamine-N5) methyltransferase, release factor-specific [Verrucomicrobia bacterium A1]|nr:MAG: protein-(glutamine-N5) methyltransferase, release factor-specific [Verrucomicrobia bacterium A1]